MTGNRPDLDLVWMILQRLEKDEEIGDQWPIIPCELQQAIVKRFLPIKVKEMLNMILSGK